MIKLFLAICRHPLARLNKMAALRRVFKWQFASRIIKLPVVYPFVNKSRLIIAKGMSGVTANIYLGLVDFEEMGFTLHFLRPEDYFVDVGANVGTFTVLSSAVAQARTMSIEPIRSACEALRDNVRLNGVLDKVVILNIGLASKPGVLPFSFSRGVTNRVVREEDNEKYIQFIEVKRLDDLVTAEIPNLVKIDVEGFESEVIKGAQSVLKNSGCKAITVELKGHGRIYGFDENKASGYLASLGYFPYAYDPFMRMLTRINSIRKGSSTIFVKDYDFVQRRVSTAEKFNILDKLI